MEDAARIAEEAPAIERSAAPSAPYHPPMFLEALRRYRRTKQLVGFCKWRDGQGLLFGRVLEVDGARVRFALVHPDGTFDEEIAVRVSELTRLEESEEYVRRLVLFATFVPPVPKAKGQLTTARATIARRLIVACDSGECVGITLLGETRRDCRVLLVDDGCVAFQQFADDPFVAIDSCVTRLTQVAELRWRSSAELAVTRAWTEAATRRRRRGRS
jgi:hypothetical protein